MATIKYPIREYLGKYEGYTIRLYGGRKLALVDKHLEKFLSYFPDYQGWEQFTIADVNDYRIWRTREGENPNTLAISLRQIKQFFKWMTEECDVPLHNPVKRFQMPQSKNRLSLDDFRRLLAAGSDELKDWLICYVSDTPYVGRLKARALNSEFTKASTRCGLTWIQGIGSFKIAIRGLWREVMRREAPKLRAEFIVEDEWSDVT